MNPLVHVQVGSFLANAGSYNLRERRLIMLAAAAPDLDGALMFVGDLAKYHHTVSRSSNDCFMGREQSLPINLADICLHKSSAVPGAFGDKLENALWVMMKNDMLSLWLRSGQVQAGEVEDVRKGDGVKVAGPNRPATLDLPGFRSFRETK